MRDGTVAPDISTPAAFKQALVAARSVAFSDAAVGGSAGVHLAKLFVEMGLADAIARKGMPQQSGGEVANRVANGEADIGMTLIAEIVPIQGARVIGPLPAPLGNDTTYAAAVMAAAAPGRRAGVHWRADTAVGTRRLGGCGVQVALAIVIEGGQWHRSGTLKNKLGRQLQAGDIYSFRIVSIQRIQRRERQQICCP